VIQRIDLTAQELMHQARLTAHDYMNSAHDCVEQTFGDGFCEKNPDAASRLIAGYMTTAAMDFGTAIIAQRLERLADTVSAISDGSEPISDSIGNVGSALSTLAEGSVQRSQKCLTSTGGVESDDETSRS
jgi:hypothetical protein